MCLSSFRQEQTNLHFLQFFLRQLQILNCVRYPVHQLRVTTYEHKSAELDGMRNRPQECQEGGETHSCSHKYASILKHSRLAWRSKRSIYIDIWHFFLLDFRSCFFLLLCYHIKRSASWSSDLTSELVRVRWSGGRIRLDETVGEVTSSFDYEVNRLVVHARRNGEGMPLITTEFRNIHEHVLAWLHHHPSWLE